MQDQLLRLNKSTFVNKCLHMSTNVYMTKQTKRPWRIFAHQGQFAPCTGEVFGLSCLCRVSRAGTSSQQTPPNARPDFSRERVGLLCGRQKEKQIQTQATLAPICDLARDIVVCPQGRYPKDWILWGFTEYLYLPTRQTVPWLGHGGKGLCVGY